MNSHAGTADAITGMLMTPLYTYAASPLWRVALEIGNEID